MKQMCGGGRKVVKMEAAYQNVSEVNEIVRPATLNFNKAMTFLAVELYHFPGLHDFRGLMSM